MFSWRRLRNAIDEIYAHSLGLLGFGHPVWIPEPHDSGEPHIGDVGYMLKGRFIRLFNVDTSAAAKKVTFWKPPFENIQPLPSQALVVNRTPNYLPPSDYCSHGVYACTAQAQVNAAGAGAVPTAGVSVEYTCEETKGAAMRLKSWAHAEDTFPNTDLQSYVLQFYDDWHEYATRTLRHAINYGDLVLVTGWVKTTPDWQLIAWSDNSSRLGAALQVQHAGAASVGFSASKTRSVTSTPIRRQGRDYSALPVAVGLAPVGDPNQCLFIKRMKVEKRVLGSKKLTANAGYHRLPDPESNSDGELEDISMTGQYIRSDTDMTDDFRVEPPDPLEILISYIFEVSDAQLAIASDGEIARILDGQRVIDFASRLRQTQPRVHVDKNGCGSLFVEDAIQYQQDIIVTRPSTSSRLPSISPPRLQTLQHTLSFLPVQVDARPSSSERTGLHDRRVFTGLRMPDGSTDSSGIATNTAFFTRQTYRTRIPRFATTVGSFGDKSISSTASSTGHESVSDDSDSESATIWAIPSNKLPTGSRPILPPIDTDTSPSSRTTSSLPRKDSRQPPLPGYVPESPPGPIRSRRGQTSGKSSKSRRTSRFDDRFDVTWASRPPPEEVLERLQEYFPEHDVDEPVLDAQSSGTSPTEPTPDSVPMPTAEEHSRQKKSIRVVAAERRRIDRTTHVQPPNSRAGAASRKLLTKVWGSRVEEVPTYYQAQLEQPLPSASDASPATAKPIFRWVRGELIGKGTYGKVYLALNATTGEMIAVKQIEMPRTARGKSDTSQITAAEALKLESETLKDLDHPNIVQYLGIEETLSFLSIFLEYVPGGSIASCLRKCGKFSEDVTKSFTGQILCGLSYLHSKGILHRDLKTDNILVETSGICKISDFGVAKRTDDTNFAGAHTSMQGTVFWMAPEVIDGKKGYNSKIDIWDVGCVAFEMWTGQRPWNGKEAMAVLLQLYNTKQGPPIPSDISLSPLADDFRQKCFAMNPDDRPTAAELRLHPYLELPLDWTFTGLT